jgi:hypothetical protein
MPKLPRPSVLVLALSLAACAGTAACNSAETSPTPVATQTRSLGFECAGRPTGRGVPPSRVVAGEDSALGLSGLEGGAQGLTLKGPDGKTYSVAIRPLLPNESA